MPLFKDIKRNNSVLENKQYCRMCPSELLSGWEVSIGLCRRCYDMEFGEREVNSYGENREQEDY